MKILMPKPPKSPSQPQWWVLSVDIHRRSAIGRVIDIFVRAKWISFQIRRNAAVDNPGELKFIRPSRFTSVYIVHPNGGGAQKLKCEECGAEYPFPVTGRAYACGFCAVERESVARLWWRRGRMKLRSEGISTTPAVLYIKMRQWPRTSVSINDKP
jgi:hypothetical protein